MQLNGSRVLLTGAAGGIGRVIAKKMISRGAQVLMVDRDTRALASAAANLGAFHSRYEECAVNLASAEERSRLCDHARSWRGGITVLINNAGLNPFSLYEDLAPAQIDAALSVNLQAPMHLCHELLPHLKMQSAAAILNTGSVFGMIGYPGYVAYCTTKFALRGFTEALRRELAGSRVEVKYLAPRATRTPINSSMVVRMNQELGVAMDSPERVAQELIVLLSSRRSSAVVGWPEKLFTKINGLLPSVVDRAIGKQLPVIERFARSAYTSQPQSPGTREELDLGKVGS